MARGVWRGLMTDRFSADDLSSRSRGAPRAIDLAHTAPFCIGAIEVRPASRELVSDGRRELLEPLVMQVLVALHSARGATLSRDDLIDACWGGRAISDDAISRVISRLRAVGKARGGFTVETMPKIGYRLVAAAEADAPLPDTDRRRLLLAGGASIALALGLIGYRRWIEPASQDSAAAGAELLEKGLASLQNNDIIEAPDPGTSLQALALLDDAVAANPRSATAWGALAVAYSVRKRAVPPADRPGLDRRGREAAERALALDPTEARALAALRLLDPTYRNWIAAERANRQTYEKNPTVPITGAVMSNFLGGVGRWNEAARYLMAVDRSKFVIPGVEWRLLIDLWSSGDLQAADRQSEFAFRRWPQHPRVWRTHILYLLYSGRPAEAVSALQKKADIPVEIREDHLASIRATADALAGQRPAAEAIATNLDYLRSNSGFALHVAQACTALGAIDEAFAILDGYYFARGQWGGVAPQGGDDDRITGPIFQPMMRTLWGEPRFNSLLEQIGLNAYWRASHSTPDFRRA